MDIETIRLVGIVALAQVLAPLMLGALWVYPDAQRRGLPGALWTALTLPFGWFAILAYLIVRRSKPRLSAKPE
jgi:hypothetical protein